jgi:TetR/AcrR family transcriptional regulator, cholesterol catabolism regulator
MKPKRRTSKRSAAKPAAPDNRRQDLLDEAARLFSARGFAGTSIRDIASSVGMLSGSMYYHFRSKEELALAVHAEGVRHIQDSVDAALARVQGSDPWQRLEAACTAHVEALLTGTDYAQVVTPQFARALPQALRRTLIAQRDSYEKLFVELVDGLALPKSTDKRYFRLALLGALNWTLTWYHPGGDPPAKIARGVLAMFRPSGRSSR